MNKGRLFVIAAPSGTGKTSLVAALLASVERLKISISYTTRPMRPGEENDLDYHFVTREMFQQMIEHYDFLEYAQVFDHYYGTGKKWVLKQLDKGVDVILEIDWQGAVQINALFESAVLIFVLPPSIQALEKRLLNRQQDSLEVIKRRLSEARVEISHSNVFDYLVVNDDFDQALAEIKNIIDVVRFGKKAQFSRHEELVAQLLKTD